MPHGIARRTVLAATAATATAAALAAPATAFAAAPAADPDLPDGTSQDKVLIVGMDGLVWDRVADADAPHLTSLTERGSLGLSLLYAPPMAATSSGPGWSTLSTGVWPDKHGVKDNSFTGKAYDRYPGLLARLAAVRPGLSTYAAVDWKPLDTQGTVTAGADAKLVFDGDADGYTAHDATIAATSERVLREQNPDVAFVYFGDSDIVAHNDGTQGQTYLDVVARQDAYVGRLLAAIEARPGYASERWTVIVTTDHGHVPSGGHGGSGEAEREVFVLAAGPGIPAGGRPVDTRLVDVAATALHALGVPVDPAWNLDGRPLQRPVPDAFDALYPALSGRVDETGIPAGTKGFTHTPPSGWSVVNSAMGTGGVSEWRGWTFTTDAFWSAAQRDQQRESNVRSRGVFAVADSDEWDDKANSGRFDSTLVTPAYAVGGKSTARLEFTTHYRQEGGQTARVLASFNGGTPTEVEAYTSDVLSQPQTLTVPVPAGASSVSFRFHYTGANNWYWVVDGVRVSAS